MNHYPEGANLPAPFGDYLKIYYLGFPKLKLESMAFTEKEIREMYYISLDRGSMFRIAIAEVLFEAFEKCDIKEKRYFLGVEIYCKLLQILEDIGQFFLVKDKDIKKYFFYTTEEVTEFYKKIEQNPGYVDALLDSLKIRDNKTWKRIKKISTRKECKKSYDDILKSLHIFLNDCAKIWIKNGKKSVLVSLSQNIKHGYKIIFPNDLPKKFSDEFPDKQPRIIFHYDKVLKRFDCTDDKFDDFNFTKKNLYFIRMASGFLRVYSQIAYCKKKDKKKLLIYISDLTKLMMKYKNDLNKPINN